MLTAAILRVHPLQSLLQPRPLWLRLLRSSSSTPSWLRYGPSKQLLLLGGFISLHWFTLVLFLSYAMHPLPPTRFQQPQPSSSNIRPQQTKLDSGCEYQSSSGAVPYDPHPYPDPPASIAYTSSIEQLASSGVPFFYPLPCHRLAYCTTVGVTPTVITHTASTAGGHSYPQAGETYPQTACDSLSYPVDAPDPVHAVSPPVTVAHCFSVPQQMAVPGVRGKHKQKTGGLRTAGPSGAQSSPLSIYTPTPTSCLAKLLSSGARDRESVPSFSLDSDWCV